MRESNHAPLARRSDHLPQNGYRDPFLAFRQEMDRLFDDFFAPSRFGAFSAFSGFDFQPALEVTENEREVCVRAELPGVEEKDVEISLDGDLLTIRGEKREERAEDGDHRRLVERAYGAFERSLRLPFEPDDKDVRAEFKNGVLTVKAKKPPELSRPLKRIPIQKA